MSEPLTSYAAQFTSIDRSTQVHCEREDCSTKVFPPGTKLHYMHSVDRKKPGRHLCITCYQYYLSKSNTVRRSSASTSANAPLQPSSTTERHAVHQQLASAQRRRTSNSVQAVGAVGRGPLTGLPHTTSLQGRPVPGHAGYVMNTSGPLVHLPGQNLPHPLVQPPKGHAVQRAGYTPEHAAYPMIRHERAQQAYSTYNAEVVTVEVRVVIKPMGRVSYTLVGDIIEAIDLVPVRIGAGELKQMLYESVRPLWAKWSYNFPLHINDIKMRNHDWVELQPNNPDRDVISKQFFKQGRKGLNFRSGKCVIYFHIPNDIFGLCTTHREAEEQAQDELAQSDVAAEFTVTAISKGKKRARSSSLDGNCELPINICTVSSPTKPRPIKRSKAGGSSTQSGAAGAQLTSSTPRPMSTSSKTSDVVSPSAQQIKNALKMQRPPTNKEISSFFELESLSVLVFPVQHLEWEELVTHPHSLDSHNPEKNWYLGTPTVTVLRLDLAPSHKKKGGFKLAAFGSSTTTLPWNPKGITDICAKQAYYSKERVVSENGELVPKVFDIPYDGHQQIRYLSMEVACLVWARALLHLVYDFIDESEAKHHVKCPFRIPRFRFVEAALAVEQSSSPHKSSVFLVEEVIQETEQGTFKKYLNNVLAKPLPMATKIDQEHADFLAFSQHVQYWKTKKQVFVSDYQGGNSLLCDPQISSARELGVIFADGNIPSAHGKFETNHCCNIYCQWFDVPTDYNAWNIMSQDRMKGPLESERVDE